MIATNIDLILQKHGGARRDALIPILQEVQEICGYLSREAIVRRGRAKRRRLCRRCRLLHSLSLPSTRPDRRRISPPTAPVAYSVVRPLIYTPILA
jgi:hypothetical protein